MTTQQEQPQTEQTEQPTPPEQPPRPEAESLGRQMAHLEGIVQQMDRRLDDTNHRIDDTNRIIAELRTDMNSRMARLEGKLDRLFNLAVIGLIALLVAIIGGFITFIIAVL